MQNNFHNFLLELLNESFFDINSNPIELVFNSFSNVLMNLYYANDEEYKLYVVADKLSDNLKQLNTYLYTNFGENDDNLVILENKYSELCENFDKDLLEILDVKWLYEHIKDFLNKHNIEKKANKLSFVDKYIVKFDKNIKSLIKCYTKKIKDNSNYVVLNNINIEQSKLKIKDFEKIKHNQSIELLKLQEYVKKNKLKVAIVFEGRDSSGKSAVIKNIMDEINPDGCKVVKLGIPTEKEKNNWFERYEKELPKEGEIVLFDRSWYNRAVVEPVMGYCTEEQYNVFMYKVNDWEKSLTDNDYIIIKFWLTIKPDTQKLRTEIRKNSPVNYWKYSKNDSIIVNKWNEVTKYVNIMLKNTSKPYAPWMVIDSNDKKLAKVASVHYILSKLPYENKKVYENENNMNVIFCDVHGVLVIPEEGDTENYVKKGVIHYPPYHIWDRVAVENLNKLSLLTKSVIVLTTTLKYHMDKEDLIELAKKNGVEVHDVTPNIIKDKPGLEIMDYLSQQKVDKYVILNDQLLDIEVLYPKNFVKVNTIKGLTHYDISLAKNIL